MSKKVAVIMGSTSDWDQMKEACVMLEELQVPYTKQVISAHRMPKEMLNFAKNAREEGIEVIIAGAGGAAHLPGMVASSTTIPVIGVPMKSSTLSGWDSLLSIAQMPKGVPVATMSIGKSGAANAGIMAAKILALQDKNIQQAIEDLMERQNKMSRESSDQLD